VVALAAIQRAILEHRHPMADPVPFADQHAARSDRGRGRPGWRSPAAIFRDSFQQAAGGGFETSKGLLLQPIGDGFKPTRRADSRRRRGLIERAPVFLQGTVVELSET